jgi:CelD/BcsL family acetyltransferase involved in cellulose biosynthesis
MLREGVLVGSRANVRARVLTGFDDPLVGPARWEQLLHQGDSDVVFLTWPWLRAWWETLGDGDLLLIAAERAGEVVALAPLYATDGYVYFLGSGEADYMDFIGDVADPQVLTTLLDAARQRTSGFRGFRLPLIWHRSRTAQTLHEAARRLGLPCVLDYQMPSPEVDLRGQAEAVQATLNRSMRKREEYLRRHGRLEVRQLRDSEAIRPHLKEYYAQHVARWQTKGGRSPFADPRQRAFVERFVQLAAPHGWVRFLRLDWEGRPLAFEFAWYYHGTHYSAPWCFAVEHSRHCPGHVLLRQSLLAALAEGLSTYDLGLGDQEYKFRLPVQLNRCCSWRLDPPAAREDLPAP